MILLFDSEQALLKLLGDSLILQVRIQDQSFCLVNDRGKYFLIEASCPHSNYPMSDAKLNGQGDVVCMWHAYRFDLKTGQEKFNRCRALKTYPVLINSSGGMEVAM